MHYGIIGVWCCMPTPVIVLLLLLLLLLYGAAVWCSQVRSIQFNLKDANNPDLRRRVMTGEIDPQVCANSAAQLLFPTSGLLSGSNAPFPRVSVQEARYRQLKDTVRLSAAPATCCCFAAMSHACLHLPAHLLTVRLFHHLSMCTTFSRSDPTQFPPLNIHVACSFPPSPFTRPLHPPHPITSTCFP
jgi:hypothetical protein